MLLPFLVLHARLPFFRSYKYEVGRRVAYLDLISSTYSKAAFACFQSLIRIVHPYDRYGWHTLELYSHVCAAYADRSFGVVDAMSVDKIESGGSYSWSAALATEDTWRA